MGIEMKIMVNPGIFWLVYNIIVFILSDLCQCKCDKPENVFHL